MHTLPPLSPPLPPLPPPLPLPLPLALPKPIGHANQNNVSLSNVHSYELVRGPLLEHQTLCHTFCL
eukprot:3290092-Prymnesium_polylepis.2